MQPTTTYHKNCVRVGRGVERRAARFADKHQAVLNERERYLRKEAKRLEKQAAHTRELLAKLEARPKVKKTKKVKVEAATTNGHVALRTRKVERKTPARRPNGNGRSKTATAAA